MYVVSCAASASSRRSSTNLKSSTISSTRNVCLGDFRTFDNSIGAIFSFTVGLILGFALRRVVGFGAALYRCDFATGLWRGVGRFFIVEPILPHKRLAVLEPLSRANMRLDIYDSIWLGLRLTRAPRVLS